VTIAPAASPEASSQLIETTLRAAAGVTGMQLVYVADIEYGAEAPTCIWRQLHGKLDGISVGLNVPLADTFDVRLLRGAASSTSDSGADADYADVPMREEFGITSYVGVPLRSGSTVTGFLAGMDAATATISSAELRVLSALARMISAEASRDPDVRLRRTPTGWEVEQDDPEVVSGPTDTVESLTVAMSLADLIAGDAGSLSPGVRPQRAGDELSEADRLRIQITQLEHALSARVVIEQSIGVLAERFSVTPREAFDRIRKSARSRGQRVHDLAVSIVRSTRDGTGELPADLQQPLV
jgi:hypothetical protein